MSPRLLREPRGGSSTRCTRRVGALHVGLCHELCHELVGLDHELYKACRAPAVRPLQAQLLGCYLSPAAAWGGGVHDTLVD
jgi:hypothetical protein